VHPKFLAAAAIAIVTGTAAVAGERVDMRVPPRQALEPATVVVTAIVEPDSSNRAVQIEAEAADFYRSSMVPLDGEDGPRTTRVEFHGLPGGQYEVRMVVLGAEGRPRASAARDVTVAGGR
jgi:hypothetical protein